MPRLALLLLGWLMLACLGVQATQASVELTPQERSWIEQHPRIVLGVEKSWEPLILQNPDGSYTGVDGDTIRRLNAMLGTKITFETGKWSNMIEKFKKREIDGLSASAIQEERRSFADFTAPYNSYQKFIYVAKDNPARIFSGNDLSGKRIGHVAGNSYDKKTIESFPGAIAVSFPNHKAIFEAALSAQVEGFVGSFVTEYQLTRDSITYFKPIFPFPDSLNLVFSIRNDWPELTAILNKGIANISLQDRMQIKEQYVQDIGKRLKIAAITLSDDEKEWLAQGRKVRVRVSQFPPYMFTTPTPTGMAVDYLDLVAKRLGLQVEFVPGSSNFQAAQQDVAGAHQHFDMLLMLGHSPENDKRFAFTGDYLSAPLVIFARKDSPFMGGLDQLAGKTLAMEKGFAIKEKIGSSYPSVRLHEVGNTVEALRAVATGQADAYIGNLTNATYLIKEHHLDNLMVVAPTPFGNHAYAMASRNDWPQLVTLIDKGLAALTVEERNAIHQKWGAVELHPSIDYMLVWQVVAGAALILLALAYWNHRRMSTEIALRRRIEADLRISETSLRQAKEAAEAASVAKSAFLANMSHEMRTPLHQVIGMAGLIGREPLTPKQTDWLGKMEFASQRLSALIDTVLELTKIEAAQLKLAEAAFDIEGLVNEVLSTARPQAEEKHIEILAEAASLPFGLIGDKAHVRQALLNYVSNAIRFTETGKITLRFMLAADWGDSALIRFEVEDTGIGIAPENLPRLFTIFEQVDNSSTRKLGGLGVGLAMTRKIAEMMGGEAGCTSSAEQGSTFWFTVRLRKSAEASRSAPHKAQSPTA